MCCTYRNVLIVKGMMLVREETMWAWIGRGRRRKEESAKCCSGTSLKEICKRPKTQKNK